MDAARKAIRFILESNGTVTLYHGTQERNIESIMETGLMSPFLSTTPEQAVWWANAYKEDDTHVYLITVEVPEDRLLADLNMLNSETLSRLGVDTEGFDIRSEDMERFKELADEAGIPWDAAWDRDYGSGKSAIYLGTIPPDQLEVEKQE